MPISNAHLSQIWRCALWLFSPSTFLSLHTGLLTFCAQRARLSQNLLFQCRNCIGSCFSKQLNCRLAKENSNLMLMFHRNLRHRKNLCTVTKKRSETASVITITSPYSLSIHLALGCVPKVLCEHHLGNKIQRKHYHYKVCLNFELPLVHIGR